MDNAGYELFTDLCLADFLIASNMATKVNSLCWKVTNFHFGESLKIQFFYEKLNFTMLPQQTLKNLDNVYFSVSDSVP